MGIITQLCGIVICLILAFFYQQQRKLELATQSAFTRMWFVVFLGLVLDILSIGVTRQTNFWGEIITAMVCNLYLMTILWEQVPGVLYIDTYISEQHDFKQKETWTHIIFGIVGSAIIVIAPIANMANRGKDGYHFGQASIITYILEIILLIRMITMLTKYRRQMPKDSRRAA